MKWREMMINAVDDSMIGVQVTIAGWVRRQRDHGGILFVDLVDISGRIQLVFDPNKVDFTIAGNLHLEDVISISGKVVARPEEHQNLECTHGDIEIQVEQYSCLNHASHSVFPIDGQANVHEEVRLRQRVLDLRRPVMQQRLKQRSKTLQLVRAFLSGRGGYEIETPYLTRSTPEGARDFIVPSRLQPGFCYGLPQSPQIFKQLLMAAGMDSYFQIVRCFRDEDSRADRQAEFTQIDIECSFVEQQQVMALGEEMIKLLFRELLGIEWSQPFPVLTYQQAMTEYGCDRPDLRNPLKLIEISDLLLGSNFQIFAKIAAESSNRIAVLKLRDGAKLSRGQLDHYTQQMREQGLPGLAYLKILSAEAMQGPIAKQLEAEIIQAICRRCDSKPGDILFFAAGSKALVANSMSALRDQLAIDFSLIKEKWAINWVVDFPMFEQSKQGKLQAVHHPFTAAQTDIHSDMSTEQLLSLPAQAYDLVINGYEAGGGSIRIHQLQQQLEVFKYLGFDQTTAYQHFGHLLHGLASGCPPHGGIAFGVDRLLMLFSDCTNIRDVIAFPKTQSGWCLLSQAPNVIDDQQWRELGIKAPALSTE